MSLALTLDLFGTCLRLGRRTSPYPQLALLAERMGVDDARERLRAALVSPMGLQEAWDHCSGGKPAPDGFIERLEKQLREEIDAIEPFEDAIEAIELARRHGFRVNYCSNLAAPYAEALGKLPAADGAPSLSFASGLAKPDPAALWLAARSIDRSIDRFAHAGDSARDDEAGAFRSGALFVRLIPSEHHPRRSGLLAGLQQALDRGLIDQLRSGSA